MPDRVHLAEQFLVLIRRLLYVAAVVCGVCVWCVWWQNVVRESTVQLRSVRQGSKVLRTCTLSSLLRLWMPEEIFSRADGRA